ncbi:MAG: T9SS type A sorting domain-containing protein [Bacteroidales bacterium]
MKRIFTLLFLTLFTLNFSHAQQEVIKSSQQFHEQEGFTFKKKPEQEQKMQVRLIEKLLCKDYEKIKAQRLKEKEKTKATETDSCSVEDSLALVEIYENMNGENWENQDNWLTDAPVKDWRGITVENHRVTEMDLYNINVSGNFVEELWDLTGLTYLDLSYNSIEDSITSRIENLHNLKYLYLNNNQLEELPDLSGLNNLIYCQIKNNLFSFGDLETANIETQYNYIYAPQDTLLPLDVDTTNNTITLAALAKSPNNNYQWFKDGEILTKETDSIITYEKEDHSNYHCEITNSNFPDLTLKTDSFAYTEHTVTFNVTDKNSNAIEGNTISIDVESEKTTNSDGEASFELPVGNYEYTITADRYEDTTGNFTVEGANVDKEFIMSEVSKSINSDEKLSTEIYPNPASEKITIESEIQIETAELLNLLGKVVISEQPKAEKYIMNTSKLDSGIYLLHISYENGETITKRVIIQ